MIQKRPSKGTREIDHYRRHVVRIVRVKRVQYVQHGEVLSQILS